MNLKRVPKENFMMKQKKIIRNNVSFMLTLLFAALSLYGQSVPAGWKKYNGKVFSFSYPPTWNLAQVNDGYVQIQSPTESTLTLELEHTTNFGFDVDSMLTAEKANLQQVARSTGLNVTFQSATDNLRGGSSISAAFDNGFGIIFDASVNGVAIGKSIYIMRFSTIPASSYVNNTQYREPVFNSVLFHVPNTSLTGDYAAGPIGQTTVGNLPVTKRTFSATLSLNAAGQYTYAVQQTEIPKWQLRVTGTWAVTDPSPIIPENAGQITLTPSNTQFSDGFSASDRASELNRLGYEGFPLTAVESFAIVTTPIGGIDLKKTGTRNIIHFAQTSSPPPAATVQVTDAAAFTSGPVAPGSLISIFGNFGVTQAAAPSLPLPTSLSQISVTVGGRSAPLLFVSSTQVNAQVPFETADGNALVAVTKAGASFLSSSIAIARTAPKIFAYGNKHAVATNQDYTLNSSTNPAKPGSYLIVYITGQGPLTTSVANGAGAPSSPLALTLASTTAIIGQAPAPVLFSGAAPGFAGVAQVNLQVPIGLAKAELPLIISVGGVVSNALTVSVAP
jgi:uncharacterized protein (TIGR03437 family)